MSQTSGKSLASQDDRAPSGEPAALWTGGHVDADPSDAAGDPDVRSRFGNLKHSVTTHWTVHDG